MKKIFILFSFALACYACGGGNEKDEQPAENSSNNTQEKPTTDVPKDNADYKKGLSLIAKSDCLTCHNVETKLIGPPYREIANKYENTEENRNMLAGKIIDGGKGVWGDVPMTPHPDLSKEDALTMVKYIMTLKKN